MNIRLKNGLIAGVTGAVLTLCLGSTIAALCGPVAATITGFLAGHFTARDERSPTRRAGAVAGLVAGAVAGGVTLLGQLVTGLLILGSNLGEYTANGSLPAPADDPLMTVVYFGSGLVAQLFLGLVGVVGACVTGALAGYWRDPLTPVPGGPSATSTMPASARPVSSVWRSGLKFGVFFGGALSLIIHGGVLMFLSDMGDLAAFGRWAVSAVFNTILWVAIFTVVGAGLAGLARLRRPRSQAAVAPISITDHDANL